MWRVRIICFQATIEEAWTQGRPSVLTHRLVRVSLWASQSAVLPLEDWRKAHTPPAKLAAWQKLNQTPPVFTKCHYVQNKLPPTCKHVWTSEECASEEILSDRPAGSGLEPPRDGYPCGTDAAPHKDAEFEDVWFFSSYVLVYAEHEYQFRGFY